jgi:hypothetical protein
MMIKFEEFIEDFGDDDTEKVLTFLKRDCDKYISEIGNRVLYHGTRFSGNWIIKKSRIGTRRPLSTSIEIHEDLNVGFKKKFGWPVRDGVYTISKKDYTKAYGTPHIFFPIGNYQYCWSPSVFDLFTKISLTGEVISPSLMKKIFRDEYGKSFFRNGEEIDMSTFYTSVPEDVGKEIIKSNGKVVVWNDNEYVVKKTNDIEKWLRDHSSEGAKTIQEIVNLYKDTDLIGACESGNEIIFNCEKYYILDVKYKRAIMGYKET